MANEVIFPQFEKGKKLFKFSRYFHLNSHSGHPIFYTVFFFVSPPLFFGYLNDHFSLILYFAPGHVSFIFRTGSVSPSIIQYRVNYKSIRILIQFESIVVVCQVSIISVSCEI